MRLLSGALESSPKRAYETVKSMGAAAALRLKQAVPYYAYGAMYSAATAPVLKVLYEVEYQAIANKLIPPLTLQPWVYHYAYRYCQLRDWIAPRIISQIFHHTVMIGLGEEALSRFAIQEIALKRLPKEVLNKICPKISSMIDQKWVKAARIGISAFAFSLIHAYHPLWGWPGGSTVKLIETFAVGLICASVQENTGSTLSAAAFHAGYNLPVAFHTYYSGMVAGHCMPPVSESRAIVPYFSLHPFKLSIQP